MSLPSDGNGSLTYCCLLLAAKREVWAGVMVDAVWGRLGTAGVGGVRRGSWFRPLVRLVVALRWAAVLAALLLLAWGVAAETRTSLVCNRGSFRG